MVRALSTPGVCSSTDRIAVVCASISAVGADRRMVEDCANAEDQRSASRPEASDSASANTARKAIAAEVNTVSRAD